MTRRKLAISSTAAATLGCALLPPCVSASENDRIAAITLYQATNAALLTRGKDGLSADLHLRYPDGTEAQGHDDYLMGSPARLREIRRDSEVIVVGDRMCTRTATSPFACEANEDAIYQGLRPIDAEKVFTAIRSRRPCGGMQCDVVELRQIEPDMPSDFLSEVGRSATNMSWRIQRTELLVRPDGLPFSLTEGMWKDGALVQPEATFVFDYSSPAKSIELPDVPDVR